MNTEKFKELDNLAWDIVCNWYKKTDFNPIYEGIDFSLLTRVILRCKVGKSLRLKHNLVDMSKLQPPYIASVPVKKINIFNLIRSVVTLCKLKINLKKTVCYIPQYARPVHSLCSKLFNDDKFMCVTRDVDVANRFVYPLRIEKKKSFVLFVDNLYKAILRGLENNGIVLELQDEKELSLQIQELGDLFVKAKQELNTVKPDLILCYSDESLPQMCYVLLAKRLSIKTISVQHGLDCESFYLDEPYADYMLLWGSWRKVRYEKSKNIFNSKVEVLGNPEYDKFQNMSSDAVEGKYWLYVTRPHTSDKCYSPSRLETEGIDILKDLLKILKDYPDEKLIIKPHPYDYVEDYKMIISESGISNQIEISNKPPIDLYAGARLVISEDSTAGLEAIMCERPLLHVHYASSPYTIPFQEYGVALFAANSMELRQMLERFIDKGYNYEIEINKK
jgi:hypothetical protein